MSVVLSGWTPEPGSGSVRLAEMTGHEVLMTEPSAGMVSLMMGGWSSQLVSKSQAMAQRSRKWM
jgi:hypothetical protein